MGCTRSSKNSGLSTKGFCFETLRQLSQRGPEGQTVSKNVRVISGTSLWLGYRQVGVWLPKLDRRLAYASIFVKPTG